MKLIIAHEYNTETAIICSCCNAQASTFRLVESIYIQNVKWFVLELYCGECNYNWFVWDPEYIIGGDTLYKIPYTWAIEAVAG
jgi:hypothetical protein